MKVYLDVVFFLNLVFDFLLLLTTALVRKRRVKLRKLLLGSLIGSLSLIFLFLPMNSIVLFFFKIILSLLMIVSTFGYKDRSSFLQYLLTFYFSSILLGGFLYFLNVQFSYKNEGLVFFYQGLSVNAIFLIVASPIILYCYIKQVKKLKIQRSTYYTVEVYLTKDEKLTLQGYLDTGNQLFDPYKHRPVLLLYHNQIDIPYEKCIPVPYEALNYHGVLRCRKVEKVVIDGVCVGKQVLIAKSVEPFRLPEVEILLHPDLF